VSILTQAMNMIKQGFGKEGYEKNVRILWKGLFIGKWDTIRDKKILLDSLSKDVVDETGYYYVNSTDVIKYIPRYYVAPSMLYSPDRLHYGIIGRARNLLISGTVSMMITQRLLFEICATDHGKTSYAMKPPKKYRLWLERKKLEAQANTAAAMPPQPTAMPTEYVQFGIF